MEYASGKCLQMCPLEEIQMRERNKLLHLLEILPGTEKDPLPKADPKRVVKCFSRSAAGKKLNNEHILRPPQIMVETISYLLFDVISVQHLPWNIVYDFITDRLMAIRQEMVVQNLSPAEKIAILQPIVRFHAYAAYRLCTAEISIFDDSLNNNHLLDCIKLLLVQYDKFDANDLSHQTHREEEYLESNRPLIEALYLLFNLGNEEALCRTLKLPSNWRQSELIHLAFHISINYLNGNLIRCTKLMKNLPPLLAAISALHLPGIRQRFLKIMCATYTFSNKEAFIPVEYLRGLLLYDSRNNFDTIKSDCTKYGLLLNGSNDTFIFTRSAFNSSIKTVRPRHEEFVDKILDMKTIKSLVLFGCTDLNKSSFSI